MEGYLCFHSGVEVKLHAFIPSNFIFLDSNHIIDSIVILFHSGIYYRLIIIQNRLIIIQNRLIIIQNVD